jgi:NAD(P)-dependent dehydrogenase (short-subunit alcohol dehydrogenase family)
MKKAAIITGASSGIGRATALEFARNGYFVFLMGRSKDRLTETAMHCRSGAAVLSCDIKDAQAVKKRIEEALTSKIHRIEVLVNNAGIFHSHDTENGTDEIWTEEFEVNLLGSVRLARALFPYFKTHGGGSIVNVSSTLGLKPSANTSAYSAIKAGMINWTQSMAIEGGPAKIRVNCVCPGIVDTPIHGFHNLEADKKADVIDKMKNLQPMGRIGSVDDIAKSIYFLGSDQSAWTTGAILAVDGGINLA